MFGWSKSDHPFFSGKMKKSASPNNQKQKTLAIIQSIQQAALIFDSKLVGKTFLYIYEGKAIEVVYRTTDFLHLTGVDTALSASAFYRNAKSGKLSSGQIFFSTRHPYVLSKKKIFQLLNTSNIKRPFKLDENLTRVDDTPLHKAVRECLDNALIHADYYGRRGIVIDKEFRKITISNPGTFRVDLNT